MPSHLVLVREHGLREISEDEVLAALTDDERQRKRHLFDVDMREFRADIEGGHWDRADEYLRAKAQELIALCDSLDDPEIHFFGLAEVSALIAFGAYLGLERKVRVHDYDRDNGVWEWAGGEQKEFAVDGLPDDAYSTRQRGIIAVKVAISYPVSDSDLSEVIGDENFPTVTIRFKDEPPGLGKITSAKELEEVRQLFRSALGSIRASYQNLDEIHLFAAVPASVAFAIGQELIPRNSRPIQTYRYRDAQDGPNQRRAILIRGDDAINRDTRLDDAQRAQARELRETIWSEELSALLAQQAADSGTRWFSALEPRAALDSARPFEGVPPLAAVLKVGGHVALDGFQGEYQFEEAEKVWRLSDAIVLAMGEGVESEAALRRRVRLFFIHEYLHHAQLLTSSTAREVGKFANALEHIDYVADVYAIVHEVDREIRGYSTGQLNDEAIRGIIVRCIEDAIRSFWAFERPGQSRWEVRRVRRHLNWYWQLARVIQSTGAADAIEYLARKPVVELTGKRYVTSGRRVLVELREDDPTTKVEIAAVLENESLDRWGRGGAIDPERICVALIERDHEAMKEQFLALSRYGRERSAHASK